jgi:hypothetical protein
MAGISSLAALSVLALGGGLVLAAGTAPPAAPGGDKQPTAPAVTFRHEPNVLHIDIGGRPFADYVYSHKVITRPFFAHVKTPAGIQVTRNHPPDPDKDLKDHDTMHPGIWMSFGDISGNDYWRLKARVEHEMFVEPPKGGPGKGTFTVRNYYRNREGSDRIAEELASYTISAEPDGYLLLWESTFKPYGDTEQIVFGDQEEMGLGIRVQTPLAEQFGGEITDSEGRKGAKLIWSKHADWIDYSGTLEGKWIGMTIMPDPANFRPSWYHARDYGFIAANAFGQEAMKAGPKSAVAVKKGDALRLRYGVLIHSSDARTDVDLKQAYRRFLARVASKESARTR